VDKLTRFGVITSDHVEDGFRQVDRKFFVPRGNASIAHSDQPLKHGNVHISAPHIYGSAIEALDLVPNSSMSFLNIGSGTGYISCIVAAILGPNSLNYGVELHDDVIEHCKTSIAKWKTAAVEDRNEGPTFHFVDATADIHIIKGNGLNILTSQGEGVVGFDRIYIGAAVDKEDLANIIELLSPGGILVGPVDDELVKVARVGVIARRLEADHMDSGDEDLSDLNEEFTSQILSGVRFAPLVMSPVVNTIIPSRVWSPSLQRGYPCEFKLASKQLLMCSNSQLVQPIRLPSIEERINVSAMLPRTIWLEILSYTHRKWFQPEQNETEYLKQRLRQEKAKFLKAEKARKEAEARCLAAERERSVYRLLAIRCQSRLLRSHESRNFQQQDAAEELFDILDLVDGVQDTANAGLQFENQSIFSDLRSMLQQLAGIAGSQADNDDASVGDAEPGAEDMEEDDASENQDYSSEDENESDFDDVDSAGGERAEDDSMEDADILSDTGERSDNQPRSVSVSSDDL